MDDTLLKMLELSGKGYCCSQVMLRMVLDMQGKENPDLIRAMAGLCNGIAFSSNVCGAFSGGACLLSYYAGKGSDTDETSQGYATMLTDFAHWFNMEMGSRFGGINCAEILMRSPDRSVCKDIVLESYSKAIELLTQNGIDPSEECS